MPSVAARLFALTLLVAAALAIAPSKLPHPADPFADPAHDPYNPLRYIPNNVLTAVATALVGVVALAQVFMTVKYRIYWMLVMTIGCFSFAFGISVRFALAKHPESNNTYLAEYLLVVLSPCAFIAGTYVLLGRLTRYLRADRHLLIRPTRITLIFVLSDVVTFVIQALGASIAVVSQDVDKVKLGANLFKAGLILQLVSWGFFTIMTIVFMIRVYKLEPNTWIADRDAGKNFFHDWRALFLLLSIACLTIMIRCAYRVAEAVQGIHGHLATTEWCFYTFDTLPLFICIATYVPLWPGRFIPSTQARVGPVDDKSVPMDPMYPRVNTGTAH